jgi:hypothetical protein
MLQYACSAMSFYSLIAVSHAVTAVLFLWVGRRLNRPFGEKYSNEVLNSKRTKSR